MQRRPPRDGAAGNKKIGVISNPDIPQHRPNGKHAGAGAPAPLDLLGRGHHRWPGALQIDAELRACILRREVCDS
jgi:hypothetical protein